LRCRSKRFGPHLEQGEGFHELAPGLAGLGAVHERQNVALLDRPANLREDLPDLARDRRGQVCDAGGVVGDFTRCGNRLDHGCFHAATTWMPARTTAASEASWILRALQLALGAVGGADGKNPALAALAPDRPP